jgi:hypothetical protein
MKICLNLFGKVEDKLEVLSKISKAGDEKLQKILSKVVSLDMDMVSYPKIVFVLLNFTFG